MDSANRELTEDEKEVIEHFDKISRERLSSSLINNGNINTCQYNNILIQCNISNNVFSKDGLLSHILWYKYLVNVQEYLSPSQYKYQSIESFLNAYPNKFDKCDIREKECLRKTANLMVVLLSMVTPRKNKGLAITVVPKVIEGINAKYVTGSGQTKATADRVHIFETEGGIAAFRRGGRTKSSAKGKRQQRHDDSIKASLPPSKKSNYISSGHDQQQSPVQKFLLIDQPIEFSSSYSLLDGSAGSCFDLIEERKDNTFHHHHQNSYYKNTNIFNSFISGYNDDDFFECFTNVQEVPKANVQKIESRSYINIHSNDDDNNDSSEAKQREQFANIMRSHDKLSKLFTWGPSALLQQPSSGYETKMASSSSINIDDNVNEFIVSSSSFSDINDLDVNFDM